MAADTAGLRTLWDCGHSRASSTVGAVALWAPRGCGVVELRDCGRNPGNYTVTVAM